MRTLHFICKCTTKRQGAEFGRLMQRLGVLWINGDAITANNIRWRSRNTTYYLRDGHLQRGDDYEMVKCYAENRGCTSQVDGSMISESLSVKWIKRMYHEIQ